MIFTCNDTNLAPSSEYIYKQSGLDDVTTGCHRLFYYEIDVTVQNYQVIFYFFLYKGTIMLVLCMSLIFSINKDSSSSTLVFRCPLPDEASLSGRKVGIYHNNHLDW